MYEECLGPLCTVSCDDLGVGNLTVMASYEALTGPFVAISDYSFATPVCLLSPTYMRGRECVCERERERENEGMID